MFPFRAHYNPADNDSEYINPPVAALLQKRLIEFTPSRPRKTKASAPRLCLLIRSTSVVVPDTTLPRPLFPTRLYLLRPWSRPPSLESSCLPAVVLTPLTYIPVGNDNAWAESKNGAVVRKVFGYTPIPQRGAPLINEFNQQHLNPYLTLIGLASFPRRSSITTVNRVKPIPTSA